MNDVRFSSLLGVRRWSSGIAALVVAATTAGAALAAEPVHIGVPTKAYWPTSVVEAAIRQGLFEKEGLEPELTIYKGGGEELEALAAGAADMILVTPTLVATGRNKGVASKIVATGNRVYSGWHIMVPPDSPIKTVGDLAGKKVAITSTGGGADILALWTIQSKGVDFTRVPVGGGGLVPSMISGNVDAAVMNPPLTYKMFESKEGRSVLAFAEAVPPHLAGAWTTSDKLIEEKPEFVQKTINAIFGGLQYLRTHRDYAIELIAEINEVSPTIAAQEYEQGILALSPDGAISEEGVRTALDLTRLIGMTDLAPIEDIYTTKFKPVPTPAP